MTSDQNNSCCCLIEVEASLASTTSSTSRGIALGPSLLETAFRKAIQDRAFCMGTYIPSNLMH